MHSHDAHPVRIRLVVDSLCQGGGTENQILMLLKALDGSRVSVAVSSLRDPIECPEAWTNVRWNGHAFHRLFSTNAANLLFRLAKGLRDEHADLVLPFFLDGNLLGTLAARIARVPVISSRRNLGRNYWHTPNQLRILRVLNRMTHHWLANSEAVRQYTAQAEGVPLDRITVIRNAIDTERFNPATTEEHQAARQRFGISTSDRVIACVANLRPVKDHRTLLKAFALALEADGDLCLLLAGRGDEEPGLRTLAAELGIADRVRFLGGLDDTAPVFHASDAAVLSSVSESLPNAIMEGLACSLPAAATNVGGVPELLAGQPFGRLAPPSDPEALAAALTDLLAGPVQDPAAREAARAFSVANFSLPVILEQWYAFLERCRAETRNR